MSDWRNPGSRLTVLSTVVVAVLSIGTGLANVGISGAVATFVPAVVRETASFTGALTGFLLLVGAFELRRGYRAAWLVTVVLLPITTLQGLLQSSSLSVPLVLLSVVAFVLVWRNRSAFVRVLSVSTTQLAALAALLGAQAYGTVGAYALREDFSGVSTVVDALYFALVTASTVGYGDATASTQTARLFALSVVVVGASSFALALGSLLGPAIEARLEGALGRMSDNRLATIEDHVLVLGVGDLTEPIVDELAGEALVLVSPDALPAALAERGIDHLPADPSDEKALSHAGIDRARAVVAASDDDGADALVVLTARQLSPDARIVAAAENAENVPKLKRAGADTVLSPATIGGHLLARSAVGDEGIEALAARVLDVSTGETSVRGSDVTAGGEDSTGDG